MSDSSMRSLSAGIFSALAEAARVNGEFRRYHELRGCAARLRRTDKLEKHQARMTADSWNRPHRQVSISEMMREVDDASRTRS